LAVLVMIILLALIVMVLEQLGVVKAISSGGH
jgi:hypothetical protein